MPARSQPVTDEEMLNEGEYDDMWPSRPPTSTRRYQRSADVSTETGLTGDVQSQRGSARLPGELHTIPPRRTATRNRLPALPATPPARIPLEEDEEPVAATPKQVPGRSRQLAPRGPRRLHWLFFSGLAMLVMVLGWIALSAVGNWWQTTLDDWHYGRPRTYQTDAVVGHHDSTQNPSHFIAMNLNRHIIIIEMPGGDVSKSVVYSGPTLLGPGQDLTPVTLSFQDLNHDNQPDMSVSVQGSQFVFLNQHGTFVPSSQNLNATG
ncbi:MAG TPA: hypothetical protein VGD98_24605 [Ktedonobacteraceae bacterium]